MSLFPTGLRGPLGLLAITTASLTLAACGGDDNGKAGSAADLPSSAVAKIGDTEISKDQFDKAFATRASGNSPFGAGSSGTPLDPPDFNKCESGMRKAFRNTSRSQGGQKITIPPSAQLKQMCQTQYDQMRGTVMTTLIQQQWQSNEAERLKVTVPDKEVTQMFNSYLKQAGGKAKLDAQLEKAGSSEEALREEIHRLLLAQKLSTQASGGNIKAPTAAQTRKFYDENPQLFGPAAERHISIVTSKTEKLANDAAKAMRSRTKIAEVVQRYGQGAAGAQGTITVQQGSGQLTPEVNKAVFAAKIGGVTGPVRSKTNGMYAVFIVRSAKAGNPEAFSKVKQQAAAQYQARQQQNASAKFQNEMADRWRKQTVCSDEKNKDGTPVYLVPQCSNGPELQKIPTL